MNISHSHQFICYPIKILAASISVKNLTQVVVASSTLDFLLVFFLFIYFLAVLGFELKAFRFAR
jgi:hypothetical protein